MIGMHDFSLMVLEPERHERPFQARRMTAARAHLLDAQAALPRRRKDAIPTGFASFRRRGRAACASSRCARAAVIRRRRKDAIPTGFALAVFPGGWQPTHA